MPDMEYLNEKGATGTQIYSHRIHSGEWIMALSGQTRAQTVDRMRTDAIIAAVENGYIQPIKQAQVQFAYSDPVSQKDAKKTEILDFVKQNMSRINLSLALGQSALCLPYGYQVFEPVYEAVNGKLWLKKLAPRLASTIWKWYVSETGELQGIQQQVYVPKNNGAYSSMEYPDIPAYKLLVITHKQEGSNFEGSSEYRPFYREWLIKDKTIKQLAITIERVGGGIPVALLKDGAPDTTKNAQGDVVQAGAIDEVESVLQDLMGSENAYAVLKWVEKLDLLTLKPEAISEMMNLVKYTDETMAKSAFQLFMNLGTSSSGSRALGQTFEDLYYEALYGIGTEIAEAWNTQLIRRMVEINYGPQDAYPKMSLSFQRNLGPVLQIYAILKEKGLVSGNKDFENFVNDWYGLPATNDQNRLIAVPSIPAQPTPSLPASVQAAECTCGHHKKSFSDVIVAFNPNRKPTEDEAKILNLNEITNNMNTLVNSLAQDLRSEVQPVITSAAKELGKGEKIYNVKINFGNKVADLFRKYYGKMLRMARFDIESELQRQDGGKKKLSELQLDDTRIQSAAEFEKWVNEASNIDSELLSTDIKQSLVKYYKTAVNQGLTGAGLSEFILDAFIAEVGQRYAASANSLTAAYGMVREVAAEEMSTIIGGKVRTEIFDTNLCDYCREHDGDEYEYDEKADDYIGPMGESAPELHDAAQNPCLGNLYGNACRGMYLYKLRG